MISFSSVRLSTSRLLLRSFEQNDAAAVFRMNSDPEVLRYTTWKPLQSLQEAENWIGTVQETQYARQGYGRLAVVLRETGELIGWSGVKRNDEPGLDTLGYRFLKPYWGKGLASEAAEASLYHAFHTIGLARIFASAYAENQPSRRVLEKSGFTALEPSEDLPAEFCWYLIQKPQDPSAGKTPVFESATLSFHEITTADTGLMYALNSDREVVQYTGDDAFGSPQAAGEFLATIEARNRKHGFGRWKIVSRTTGECYGWCGLKKDEETGEIDLGYRLFRRFWGKGIATEAAQASLDFGFSKLGLQKIVGRARLDNGASIRVLEKCGMAFERQVRDCGGDCAVLAIYAGR